MKTLIVIFLLYLTCLSCTESKFCKTDTSNALTEENNIIIDTTKVLKEKLVLHPTEGKWYYHDQPYSGYSLKFHFNDTLSEKIGYYMGKREDIAKKWSENGTLRIESYYKQNRLEGVYKTWWENGVLASQSYYKNGVKHGLVKEWYTTGQLAKERRLIDGKEEGLQKAWLENGKLYINYEAKNGRIFGMRRANSCYQLENESVVTN